VGLVLLAALILAAAAALSSPEADRGLGELVARRITRTPGDLVPAQSGPAAAAGRLIAAPPAARPRAPAVPQRAPAPTPRTRAVDAFRRLRGLGRITRHAWIVCLGYRRWRHELEHPSAPTEALPLGEALDIANDCLNPYDFLVED
jgi:hypothetical protein